MVCLRLARRLWGLELGVGGLELGVGGLELGLCLALRLVVPHQIDTHKAVHSYLVVYIANRSGLGDIVAFLH
jgi:hypothetical protein